MKNTEQGKAKYKDAYESWVYGSYDFSMMETCHELNKGGFVGKE